MKTEDITKNGQIEELKNAIRVGIEAFATAGRMLVNMLDDGGLNLPEISEASQIPVDVLGQIEKIGRGQLCPQLLLANYPAARRIERLPMSEQERLMNGPVEVLTMRDGQVDSLMVHAEHLTASQVKQVFAANHVRSLAEQRQWIESQTPASKIVTADVPYLLTRKSTVIFKQGCEMTARELLRIAAQLQD